MSEPIRILRVIARMNVGGPALQISGLARQLDPARFEQRILCGQLEDGEADWLTLRAPDVDVVRVPGLARSIGAGRELRALAGIAQEVTRFQPHVVHTHAAKAGVLGRLAATLRTPSRRPATVHTFHGHLLHGYFGPAGTAAVRTAERTLARRTTRLIAVGEQVRDELLAAGVGKPEQYTVVPPGLELPPGPPRAQARAMLGLPPDVPVVAYVARLTGIKRPDRLLATARLLRARVPDAVVVVVGDGPLAQVTRQEAQALDGAVRFTGWRADVETVYAAADLALLTSDNEGTPVSLIEAGLCGVPCVSTRVGSVAEVVTDGITGLLTAPRAEDLAEAVARLLHDPRLRLEMGAAARRHTHAKFSLSRLVNDHTDLYCRLVHDRGGHTCAH